MSTIKIWDWKFKIGLIRDIYIDVNKNIENFSLEEKKIYNKIIDYHTNKISLDVILDILIENKFNSWKDTMMNDISLIKPNLIGINSKLYEFFKAKMNIAIKNNPSLDYEINELFSAACNNNNNSYDNVEEIFRCILGKYYDEVIKLLIDKYQFVSEIKEKIQYNDIKKHVNSYIKKLSDDIKIRKMYGANIINEYDIKLVNEVGFAEWWDKDLTNNDKDLLVLFQNNDSMNKDDFEYTIYHEVYPGHGYFYNYARNNRGAKSSFDHGAMTLVEGWATFCEWNVKKTDYSRTLKNRGKEFLEISLDKNKSLEEKINMLYANSIKRGYSKDQAINTILYFSQYPTFLESYYLGALCIEVMINKGVFRNPADFLDYLKNKTWGELFALWG